MTANISRRAALRGAAFVAAGLALGSRALAAPAHAAGPPDPVELRQAIRDAQERERRILAGHPSKNGWEMENVADDRGNIHTRPVPGTAIDLQMRMAEVETILVYTVSRFHYEIESLRRGEVVGWCQPNSVDRKLPESNLASGTAVRIRPGAYPSGTRGGFYSLQEMTIRDILAPCEGVVRWGGDDRLPDESLFYIDVPPGDERLSLVAAKIRMWNQTPGFGPGVLADPLQPQRRKLAKRLSLQQAEGAR